MASHAVSSRPRTSLRRPSPVLIAAAIAVGCSTAAAAAESAGAAGMAVSVVRAKKACFSDTVRLTGTIAPREESRVWAEADGLRISQVLVEDGDKVTAGQVLARLARPENQTVSSSSLAVTAPSAGIVARATAQVGGIASMAAPPLFHVFVGPDYEMRAEAPSTRISKLAVGQPARVDVAGLGEISGRVRLVAPAIDPGAQAGQVRISLDQIDRLRAGVYAHAKIEVGTSCGASVPLSALIYGSDGALIQVVRDNRVETRPVPVGLLAGGDAEIREGLREGDLVVKRAASFLREGDRVRPILDDAGSGK
jgi:multidrug efflux pump subunit AcrA (membrane-fusion protein)